jgi:hypothetical protein
LSDEEYENFRENKEFPDVTMMFVYTTFHMPNSNNSFSITTKSKGKFRPITGHQGPRGEVDV